MTVVETGLWKQIVCLLKQSKPHYVDLERLALLAYSAFLRTTLSQNSSKNVSFTDLFL